MELTTIALIAITSVVTIYSWKHSELQQKLIFWPFKISNSREYFRFLSSGFIHADWTHLIFNMIALYFFGQAVESIFTAYFGALNGILIYLLIYLGGIIFSDLPTYFKHRKEYNYLALGASGGVSAIIFSSILFFPLNKICLYGLICLPGFIMAGLFLVYSYFQAKRMGGRINHDAHFYGAVYGVVITLSLVPQAWFHFYEQIKIYLTQ